MNEKREELIFMSRLAEQTERYEDMAQYLKTLLLSGNKELTNDERNLLSIAYKNVLGQRRTAWRAICTFEIKEKLKAQKFSEAIDFYKERIEKEMEKYCLEILKFIEELANRKNQNHEATIFYYKMKGDYNRYLAEFGQGQQQEKAIQNADSGYKQAIDILEKQNYSKSHLLRLGVYLNYSVFQYEIVNDVNYACVLAKQALEEAMNELDDMTDEQYKDATTILQLIKDNLTSWTQELGQGN